MKTIFIFLSFLAFNACSTMQHNSDKPSSKKIDLSQEGFTYVQVVINKEKTDCSEVFVAENGDTFEFYFKNENIKELADEYWIKFRRLRRLPKCKEAQPIEVTEIRNVTYE